MPEVHDATDKNKLYQQISSKLDSKQPKKRVNPVPLLGTLMAAVILILIVPSLINTVNQNTGNDNPIADKAMENSESNQVTNESANEIQQEESADIGGAESEIMMMNEPLESYVIGGNHQGSAVANGAVTDLQNQYVIPVSFVISESENMDDFYNEMDQHIDEQAWGVSDYLFEDVAFEINHSVKEVEINLPADFSLGEGSATANLFERMLGLMFVHHGIDKAVFPTDNNQGVELGPFGTMKELSLPRPGRASYKLYQEESADRSFLVPVPHKKDLTIDEALTEMKSGDEDFNVFQTIPENVELTTESAKDTLEVTFSNEESVRNDQETLTMIEAILMTAKDYGYDSVTFKHTASKIVGLYSLTEPIPVPKAINPINQN